MTSNLHPTVPEAAPRGGEPEEVRGRVEYWSEEAGLGWIFYNQDEDRAGITRQSLGALLGQRIRVGDYVIALVDRYNFAQIVQKLER